MNLLLLDKDGTLIAPVSGERFVQNPYDQAALPGAKEAIARHVAEGWVPVVVSNQGGVAAKHKTLEDCFLEMRFVLELFPEIKEAYFCPDFEGEICWRCWGDCSESHRIKYTPDCSEFDLVDYPLKFRKPDFGMLWLANHHHCPNYDDEALMVGDREEDEQAAQGAGVFFQDAENFRLNGLRLAGVMPEICPTNC